MVWCTSVRGGEEHMSCHQLCFLPVCMAVQVLPAPVRKWSLTCRELDLTTERSCCNPRRGTYGIISQTHKVSGRASSYRSTLRSPRFAHLLCRAMLCTLAQVHTAIKSDNRLLDPAATSIATS